MARALEWASFRNEFEQAVDAELFLVEHLLSRDTERVLDLGCGAGQMIAVVREELPGIAAVGLDLSPTMVLAARRHFLGHPESEIRVHDLMEPLPDDLGEFDTVVSGLVIHNLPDERKRSLCAEAFNVLRPGGYFYNLDVVDAPSVRVHASQATLGFDERQPNQPAPLENQLAWLREAGFEDVDCFWKWFELAVVGGRRPASPPNLNLIES
jgi:SAM-dependent methyltransferase